MRFPHGVGEKGEAMSRAEGEDEEVCAKIFEAGMRILLRRRRRCVLIGKMRRGWSCR